MTQQHDSENASESPDAASPDERGAPRGIYQRLEPGSWHIPNMYTALSDGFVLCTIRYPADLSKGCIAWGYVATGWTAQVTGGNVCFFGAGWKEYMTSNPQSSLLPVEALVQFEIGLTQDGDSQVDAPYDFWWISPTGQTLGAPTPQPTNVGNRSTGPAFTPPPLPQSFSTARQDREAFIAIIERLVGKPIDARTQQQFLALGRMS